MPIQEFHLERVLAELELKMDEVCASCVAVFFFSSSAVSLRLTSACAKDESARGSYSLATAAVPFLFFQFQLFAIVVYRRRKLMHGLSSRHAHNHR